MTPEETVRAYYAALRAGDPLAPFFVESPDVVKFGIGERLAGYADVARGLREQTRTTDDWTVESRGLGTVVRGDDGDGGTHAAFSDDVRLAWYDTESFVDRDHETRWSGTLTRVDDGDRAWKFLGMHVSVASDG